MERTPTPSPSPVNRGEAYDRRRQRRGAPLFRPCTRQLPAALTRRTPCGCRRRAFSKFKSIYCTFCQTWLLM